MSTNWWLDALKRIQKITLENAFSQTEEVWINETCRKAKIKASAWKTILKTQYDNYEGFWTNKPETQINMVDYSSEPFLMNVCVSVVHENNHPVKYCIFHKFVIYLGRMYSLHCKYTPVE